MMRIARFAAAPLALLLLLGACITDPVTGEKSIGIPMSDEAEIEMGREYAPSFKAQYEGAYPDAELQRYCERIVLDMAKSSERPKLPWTFTILNSSQVNAFALPGGTVCITRGLLWRLDTEAEFAGVMGHEIGHVTHRHSVKAQGRSTLFGLLLLGAAIGAEESDSELAKLGVGLGAVGGQLLMLKFSRDQESQSDERGVDYSLEAGYDPRQLSEVFEVFKELKGGQGGPPAWLSTHPLDDDRIEAVGRTVRKRHPRVARTDGKGLVVNTPTWTRLISDLRDDQRVYDRYDAANARYTKAVKAGDRGEFDAVLRTLRECEKALPGHALFVSGQGVVLYGMGRKSEARREFEQAARMQDDLFEPHLYLAQIAFEDRRDEVAVRHAARGAELFPHHPMPYYIGARANDRRGNRSEAVRGYRSVLQLAPEDSQEHRYAEKRLSELSTRP